MTQTDPDDGPTVRDADDIPAVMTTIDDQRQYEVRDILFDTQWLEWTTDIDYDEID